MTEPWRYFRRAEFACHCGRCENRISDAFIAKLEQLRIACAFPMPVNSGYRCPDHNERVSSTGRSGPHTTGMAADIGVSRAQALMLIQLAPTYGFTGIGVQQKGVSRFVHLDTLPNAPGQPRPTLWSY